MSTGFIGNLGFPMPKNWAFDQFFEPDTPVGSGEGAIYIDKNGYSGRDEGASSLNPPENVREEALKQEVLKILHGIPQIKDFNNLTSNIVLDDRFRVYSSPMLDIDVITATEYELTGDVTSKISIKNGQLGTTAEQALGEGTIAKMELKDLNVKDTESFLRTAFSVENGSVTTTITPAGSRLILEVKILKQEWPLIDGTKAKLEVIVEFIFKSDLVEELVYDQIEDLKDPANFALALVGVVYLPRIVIGGIVTTEHHLFFS